MGLCRRIAWNQIRVSSQLHYSIDNNYYNHGDNIAIRKILFKRKLVIQLLQPTVLRKSNANEIQWNSRISGLFDTNKWNFVSNETSKNFRRKFESLLFLLIRNFAKFRLPLLNVLTKFRGALRNFVRIFA
jgi:hypothetical protein